MSRLEEIVRRVIAEECWTHQRPDFDLCLSVAQAVAEDAAYSVENEWVAGDVIAASLRTRYGLEVTP